MGNKALFLAKNPSCLILKRIFTKYYQIFFGVITLHAETYFSVLRFYTVYKM